MTDDSKPLAEMTATIVSAFVGKNSITHSDLPALITAVHSTLKQIVEPEAEPAEVTVKKTAAQIRKSITPDALISFIDGKPYKMLKRHVTTQGLTIADYKVRFGLPKDYPTTAPSYSAARSALAKSTGLGQGGRKPPPASARRGRPKKVTTPPQG